MCGAGSCFQAIIAVYTHTQSDYSWSECTHKINVPVFLNLFVFCKYSISILCAKKSTAPRCEFSPRFYLKSTIQQIKGFVYTIPLIRSFVIALCKYLFSSWSSMSIHARTLRADQLWDRSREFVNYTCCFTYLLWNTYFYNCVVNSFMDIVYDPLNSSMDHKILLELKFRNVQEIMRRGW